MIQDDEMEFIVKSIMLKTFKKVLSEAENKTKEELIEMLHVLIDWQEQDVYTDELRHELNLRVEK